MVWEALCANNTNVSEGEYYHDQNGRESIAVAVKSFLLLSSLSQWKWRIRCIKAVSVPVQLNVNRWLLFYWLCSAFSSQTFKQVSKDFPATQLYTRQSFPCMYLTDRGRGRGRRYVFFNPVSIGLLVTKQAICFKAALLQGCKNMNSAFWSDLDAFVSFLHKASSDFVSL